MQQSYHDLAVRLEPIILELEREHNDLLIIAHESVLRVLYGYLMACNATDIPKLEFPRNEIIEVSPSPIMSSPCDILIKHATKIIPSSYNNVAKRIHIPGVPDHAVPGSPEDISIPVPPTGTVSPMTTVGTPARGGSVVGSPVGVGSPTGVSTPLRTEVSVQPLTIGKVKVNPMG